MPPRTARRIPVDRSAGFPYGDAQDKLAFAQGKAFFLLTTDSKSSLVCRAWSIGLTIFLVSFLITTLATTVADPDLWGHVRFGLDVLENGSISQTDQYSYSAGGHRWINHEWLAELLFAIAWRLGGAAGLVLLKITTFLLMFGVVYLHLRSVSVKPLRAGLLMLLLLIVLLPFLAMVRPQVFTALLFAVVLHLVSRAESGDYRWLWLAPPLIAFWANLHGGFLAGIGVLLIWATLHMLLRRQVLSSVILPILLSILATLVNPYHVELALFLARTATVARTEITDWQPMQWGSPLGVVDLTFLLVAVLALAITRRMRMPVLLILFAATAALPFLAVRHILLSAVATVMLVGEHVADAIDRFVSRSGGKPKIRAWYPLVPAILAVSLFVLRADSFRRIELVRDFYPVEAVSLLKQSKVAGNLLVHFTWGEYVIWHLEPEIKIGMDGRRETVYPEEVYQKYLRFHYGLDKWDALLNEYRTDMALVHKKAPCWRLMSSRPEWSKVYEDSISALFIHNEEVLAKVLRTLSGFSMRDDIRSFP